MITDIHTEKQKIKNLILSKNLSHINLYTQYITNYAPKDLKFPLFYQKEETWEMGMAIVTFLDKKDGTERDFYYCSIYDIERICEDLNIDYERY